MYRTEIFGVEKNVIFESEFRQLRSPDNLVQEWNATREIKTGAIHSANLNQNNIYRFSSGTAS